MAFEYINHIRDPLYPEGGNRDERILVEFNGILHSEAEDIFYGMQDCPILEAHPFNTYQRLLSYKDTDKIYEEIGFFRPKDLVRYLNDGQDIDEDEINAIIEYSILNYDYKFLTELSMLGALVNLAKVDYVKGITVVFTNHRESDAAYLATVFTKETLMQKFSVVESSPDTVITDIEKELKEAADSNNPYTTIITNEYKLILDVLNKYEEYKAETTLFLLRNHSENMEQFVKGDSVNVKFRELYTDEITSIINGKYSKLNTNDKLTEVDFPAKAKFGRFSPTPFKTDSPAFMTFGENQETDQSSNQSKEE